MAAIQAISFFLPENTISNEDLIADFPEIANSNVFEKTGVNNRRRVGKDTLASDLALHAAEELLKEHNIERNSIDYLLCCLMEHDYFMPATACLIHERLGLSKNAAALDFNLGCSGYLYGLSLAKGLIESGQSKSLLFLTSTTITKRLFKGDKSMRVIFGDGAAATMVSTGTNGSKIGNFTLGTNGGGWDKIVLKNGRGRYPKDATTLRENYIKMNGPGVFVFGLKTVPELIKRTLKKENLQLKEIDLFVFHQANAYMLEALRKQIGIEKKKFFIYMENVGNTVASSIPIALYQAQKEGRLKSGDKVLLAAFGVGLSWGATVINW